MESQRLDPTEGKDSDTKEERDPTELWDSFVNICIIEDSREERKSKKNRLRKKFLNVLETDLQVLKAQ